MPIGSEVTQNPLPEDRGNDDKWGHEKTRVYHAL